MIDFGEDIPSPEIHRRLDQQGVADLLERLSRDTDSEKPNVASNVLRLQVFGATDLAIDR
jgi:hypothetical protein